jgi:DNA-binding XRE family transcriptional regulator
MPRKPTQKHPIRDLRGIIQKSQKDFAQIIGINPGTLKRIENNDPKLKLKRRIAARIFAETGANVDHLLRGQLRDEFGRGYTGDFYARWKKRYLRADESYAKASATRFARWLEVLLRGAARKGRFWQVLGTLNEAMDECREDFGLIAIVDFILRNSEPRVKWNPASVPPLELVEIEAERESTEKQHEELTRDLKVRWGGATLRRNNPRATKQRLSEWQRRGWNVGTSARPTKKRASKKRR